MDSRRRCTSVPVEHIAVRRRLVVEWHIEARADRQKVHSRWVVIEDHHPFEEASYAQEDIASLVELECHLVVDRVGQLLGGDARPQPCVGHPLPSSLPSILFGSL